MNTDSPRIIKAIVVIIVVAVIAVAVVANGAAYLGGVAFVRDVMKLGETVAYIFGGVLEMSLAVLSLTTLAFAYMGAPTAGIRTALWITAAASAAFGAAHEIVAYATGEMTLVEAIPSAAWRIGAVAISVALWELVINLVCGPRARQARDAERQHKLMYRYLKRVQLVGLMQGSRLASIARMMERHARMQTAKHVTPEQRTAILEKFHESQEASAVISVAMASLAQTTNDALKDLGGMSAPPIPVTATNRPAITTAAPATEDATTGTVHVQTIPAAMQSAPVVSPVQEAESYTRTAAASVATASRAIRADLKAASAAPAPKRGNKPDKAACLALIRSTWPGAGRLDVTAGEVHKLLTDAGHSLSARSADNYKNEALAS